MIGHQTQEIYNLQLNILWTQIISQLLSQFFEMVSYE